MNMEYKIENEKVEDFYNAVIKLSDKLTERIIDLHGVQGAAQERHAYIWYRNLLLEAKNLIKDNLKEVKTKGK
jgi:hypothetical protein